MKYTSDDGEVECDILADEAGTIYADIKAAENGEPYRLNAEWIRKELKFFKELNKALNEYVFQQGPKTDNGPTKCVCPTKTLMAKGCVCGGK